MDYKNLGNEYFKKNEFEKAITLYKLGIKDADGILMDLSQNISLSYFKIKKFDFSLLYAMLSISMNSKKSTKSFVIAIKILKELNHQKEAENFSKHFTQIDCFDYFKDFHSK
jgi:tetratricopeptide (TPR) repeat protein